MPIEDKFLTVHMFWFKVVVIKGSEPLVYGFINVNLQRQNIE